MSIISFNGIDYGCSGSPKIEQITEANYQALVQAGEVDPSIAYFRMDAPSLYPLIQDNGTATDLDNGKLPTGQTIKSWAKTPIRVSYDDITVATGITMRFELYSNGMKGAFLNSNTLSANLIGLPAGTVPEKYRPLHTDTKYFIGGTAAYETNGTRMIAIASNGLMYIYKSASAGLYLNVYYV